MKHEYYIEEIAKFKGESEYKLLHRGVRSSLLGVIKLTESWSYVDIHGRRCVEEFAHVLKSRKEAEEFRDWNIKNDQSAR